MVITVLILDAAVHVGSNMSGLITLRLQKARWSMTARSHRWKKVDLSREIFGKFLSKWIFGKTRPLNWSRSTKVEVIIGFSFTMGNSFMLTICLSNSGFGNYLYKVFVSSWFAVSYPLGRKPGPEGNNFKASGLHSSCGWQSGNHQPTNRAGLGGSMANVW